MTPLATSFSISPIKYTSRSRSADSLRRIPLTASIRSRRSLSFRSRCAGKGVTGDRPELWEGSDSATGSVGLCTVELATSQYACKLNARHPPPRFALRRDKSAFARDYIRVFDASFVKE